MKLRTFFYLGLLGVAGLTVGCQDNRVANTDPPATQTGGQLTPDGDRLNGPIPYPNWPYNIDRGGGGGSTR